MESHVLLCARDPAVVEAVEVSAAALQVALRVAHHPDEVRAAWPDAALRLVSTEVAARWSGVAPGAAYLVGTSAAELARCSAGLGLPILPLPDEGGHLMQAMAGAVREEAARGRVVAVMGASGGLGVSTLVASMALVAAAGGGPAAAVDLAQAGGGLDLLVGAEALDGVRWPDLHHARGELADLLPALPAVGGAGILTQGRETAGLPPTDAVTAVVASLRRAADVVVLDVGREAAGVQTDQLLLMVGADVRSVASARMLAEARGLSPTGLVVRTGPGRGIPAEVVSRSLGVPCLGVVGQHRQVPRLAELGMAPVAGPARRFRRQVAALLREVRDD